jgi:hypothetical protein
MHIKATNPFSQETDPVSWAGWEAGYAIDDPTWTPDQNKKDEFDQVFWEAFYRGQGAQIVKNYGSLDHQDAEWAHRQLTGE